MTVTTYTNDQFDLDVNSLDRHAVDICLKLQDAGYAAYIVGGGVRDLLMGLHPKDFDVATDATPEQVRSLFNNCRLIGKRFRLAHVFFRRHIIEVATFRGDHSQSNDQNKGRSTEAGMIVRDNVFGSIEEDAIRRDLTINALYYDPAKDVILDFCGGMNDLKNGTIRLIGHPESRYQEDPVRILRAMRFKAKLGFKMDPATESAIPNTSHLLDGISSGRIFDEYTKCFLHGFSNAVFNTLNEYDLFHCLFPQTAALLDEGHTESLVALSLENTDNRIREGLSINPAFLIAVFLWPCVCDQQAALRKQNFSAIDAFNKAVSEVLSLQVQTTAIPRRFSLTIREIWSFQNILERRRPRQIMPMLYNKKFRAAFDFLQLRAAFGEVSQEVLAWWETIQNLNKPAQKEMISQLSNKTTNPQDHWARLAAAGRQADTIEELNAQDPQRSKHYTIQAAGLTYDYSKTTLTKNALDLFASLAQKAELEDEITAMFAGEPINNTENRAVLHTALRNRSAKPVFFNGEDVMPMIHKQLNKMSEFVAAVHEGQWRGETGEPIQHVVNIGIGGSDLGPHMAVRALKPYHSGHVQCHFVSNVDATNLLEVLEQCSPENTLFLIASKTFTTQETLLNAQSARTWLVEKLGEAAVKKHFVAITSQPEKASEFGIPRKNCFEMWDFVGGRYSLWSTIGLPIALAVGMNHFIELLEGAHELDKHFMTAPAAKNMPIQMAFVGLWHRNVMGYSSIAVLPYDELLSLFPAYLQQLDMESNGKSVMKDGMPVKRDTGPIVWGSVGTNGQHAFHQLLHQGTTPVPADFILADKPHHKLSEHHRVLSAHCHAQMHALMSGKSLEQAEAELREQGLDEDEISELAPHKVIAGNKPSQLLKIEQLTPKTLGALIALYEHKVFVQSVIWGINAFDQWGVELGKQLANAILKKS